MCPVFVASTTEPVRPDPAEVDDVEWVDWQRFRAAVLAGERPVSPWCVDQVRLLPADPVSAPAQPRNALPPAARHPERGVA